MRNRTRNTTRETKEEQRRRVCRSGAGVQKTHMGCDTPGFTMLKEPRIMHDLRGFKHLDMKRNNRRVTQSSVYLM